MVWIWDWRNLCSPAAPSELRRQSCAVRAAPSELRRQSCAVKAAPPELRRESCAVSRLVLSIDGGKKGEPTFPGTNRYTPGKPNQEEHTHTKTKRIEAGLTISKGVSVSRQTGPAGVQGIE